MVEDTVDGQKKSRKKRSDAGVPRGPRYRPDRAPINVRLRLIGSDRFVEFGCSRRMVTDRFHVFFHPSEEDRYRETRREYAIDRIEELHITEVPGQHVEERPPTFDLRPVPSPDEVVPVVTGGPRIHSARANAIERLSAGGSQRIDKLPEKLGPGVTLGFGDSLA